MNKRAELLAKCVAGWVRPTGRSRRRRTGAVSAPQRRLLLAERLEPRQLLAVLTVGASGQYAAIQAAVDRARPGDTIEVQPGDYQESVDLSRMGSVVNQTPGNLVIRGVGAGTARVVSPGGPVFFNSQPFTGNLTLQNLALQAPTPTAAAENGVRIDRFDGRLQLTGLTIDATRESLIVVRNSAGNLQLEDNLLEDSGTFADDHGIVLESLTGVVTVANNRIDNLRGDGIHLSAAGQQELVALISRNQIIGDGTVVSTTRRGIVVQAREQAVLHAVVQGNAIDQVVDRGIVLKLEDAARYSGSLHGNALFGVGSIGTDLRIEGTARADFNFVSNDFRDTKASGIFLSLGDQADVRSRFVRNMFFEVGDTIGEDAIVITNDQGSTTRLHLLMEANDFRQVSGHGTLVQGVGTGIFNLTLTNNSYTAVNLLYGTAAVLLGQADLGSSTTFNVGFTQNIVNQAVQGSYRFEQRGTGLFWLEGSATDALAQIAATNQSGSLPGQLTSVGTIGLVALNTFADTVPLAIGDGVWRDADANGIFGDTESGLGQVVLALTGTETVSGAAVSQRTISDLDGFYQFSGLLPGTYTLRVEPLLGNSISPANQGSSSQVDSDFSPATRTVQVTLVSLIPRENVDLGLIVNWQNPVQQYDANGDTFITPLDALVVINYLNANVGNPNPGVLPLPPAAPRVPPPYLDVDGDNFATPSDVRVVINEINRRTNGGGEGESADAPLSLMVGMPVVFGPIPMVDRASSRRSGSATAVSSEGRNAVDLALFQDPAVAHRGAEKPLHDAGSLPSAEHDGDLAECSFVLFAEDDLLQVLAASRF
jgi:hypothetical protein